MADNKVTLKQELAKNVMQVRPSGYEDSVFVFKFDRLEKDEKETDKLEIITGAKKTLIEHLNMIAWSACDYVAVSDDDSRVFIIEQKSFAGYLKQLYSSNNKNYIINLDEIIPLIKDNLEQDEDLTDDEKLEVWDYFRRKYAQVFAVQRKDPASDIPISKDLSNRSREIQKKILEDILYAQIMKQLTSSLLLLFVIQAKKGIDPASKEYHFAIVNDPRQKKAIDKAADIRGLAKATRDLRVKVASHLRKDLAGKGRDGIRLSFGEVYDNYGRLSDYLSHASNAKSSDTANPSSDL